MVNFKAPLDEINFVIKDMFDIQSLSSLPGYEEIDENIIDAIIEEATKICENELHPLNLSGDIEGCHYENGVVRTPKGFKEAYDKYIESGWTAFAGDPEFGGQGLPKTLFYAVQEIFCSANLPFGLYPALSQGASEILEKFGTKEQKETYYSKLMEGTWSGTMCLTEPHCGTDLGLIKTKATPEKDGSYKITGTKIFITAGEHDLTENILHMVLAKVPGSPDGVKGISLFLVPKFLPNDDGSVGPRNGVRCGSIEHKMGIHASSTCVMNFEEAKGFLVGDLNNGLNAMFVMMNSERLSAGIQNMGLAQASYQGASDYAKERLQGRSLNGPKNPDQPADSILVHPDVRRMLLTMRAYNEAARAMSVWTGMHIDYSKKHPDPAQRQASEDFLSLMTPIIKAFFTDYGFDATNMGVQVLGGHGYIREWGMEQFVRDARIAQIYEGANGIQALDLAGRKMSMNYGRLLRQFFHPVLEFIEENRQVEGMEEFITSLEKSVTKLQQATLHLAQQGLKDANEIGAGSYDYLHLFAHVAMAYMWARMVKVALDGKGDLSKEFYQTKIKTARFYFHKLLPNVGTHFIRIMTGAKSLMDFEESEF